MGRLGRDGQGWLLTTLLTATKLTTYIVVGHSLASVVNLEIKFTMVFFSRSIGMGGPRASDEDVPISPRPPVLSAAIFLSSALCGCSRPCKRLLALLPCVPVPLWPYGGS